ncbi:MAG: serine--tRNA ligase [Ruminococcaceae bacterium]|nr:serine--tRNA ligase [Oscillospiraceae bacterium]
MLDIKFLKENPEAVKENIRKKFQDGKLPLVDEVIALDEQRRKNIQSTDQLKAQRNQISKANGGLFGRLKKAADDAEKADIQAQIDENNAKVKANADEMAALDADIQKLDARIREIMLTIPNIIDPSVPIGPDDSCNVEKEKFGEPVVPDFEIPYHTDIMERLSGLDLEAARRVAGNGFYYLMGNIARLHSAIISYARDFMIGRGFTYCVPPFMIRGGIVDGVMSFAEMDAMMYKIEGEDLYLIGTSEHSMIGKFVDQIVPEKELPYTLTSYSPCFRKEKGAHGIEERGVYRIHQFEKQEMIVICKPEDSNYWYDQMWKNSVDFFRTLDIPVRTLECCSGDLADLKVKSLDVEAWSPRQKKYFEVGSCSNLGDAQARRLKIRVKGEDGKNYFAHTLNNTVVAPPRMLIAFLENNLRADGSVAIPEALRPYMGGMTEIR